MSANPSSSRRTQYLVLLGSLLLVGGIILAIILTRPHDSGPANITGAVHATFPTLCVNVVAVPGKTANSWDIHCDPKLSFMAEANSPVMTINTVTCTVQWLTLMLSDDLLKTTKLVNCPLQ